jgi:PAS domain S-box-containing protein
MNKQPESLEDAQQQLQQTEQALAAAHQRIAALEARVADLEQQVDDSAGAALAEERNLLRTLIDSVPDYIYVKDTDHRYLLNNTAHARAIGKLTPEDMAGRRASDFFPPRLFQMFHDDEAAIYTSGQALIDRQEYFIGLNGEPFWHSTTKVPLRNLKGDIIGLVGITRNITERKRAEIALQEALHKEKELHELKSRFVSMASHEFRTPLAMILTAAEMLIRYRTKLSDDQIEQRLNQIRDQVVYLRDIMENILKVARGQATQGDFMPQPTDLDALCRMIVDEFCSRPDVHQRIVYTCDDPPRLLTIDRNRIRQALTNLIANAVKYSPPETTITIHLSHQPEEVVLRVSDQGIGIPEADQRYLFEVFHRASNVGEIAGTGLGMVITKQAVELHGGSITVQSRVGLGSTFIIRLPYKPSVETPSQPNAGTR